AVQAVVHHAVRRETSAVRSASVVPFVVIQPSTGSAAMVRLLRYLPHGEPVLPVLLAVLLVLMFVAWPLADIGVLRRPFIGILMVIVVLSALLALGGSGRFALPITLLGVLLLVLQTVAVFAPSAELTLTTEAAATVFLLLLCSVLMLGVFGPG